MNIGHSTKHVLMATESHDTALPAPLCQKHPAKNRLHRALNLLILFLLLSLLAYRLSSLRHPGGFPQLVALFCESCFTFAWICSTSTKWNLIDCSTYPDRLLERVQDLPPLDIFVTTADAGLEPPILTVNTVLSLLALDYPANKLACYVSDDGYSPVVFFSLLEASKFAKQWISFCKRYGIQVRAPFRYFIQKPSSLLENGTPGFYKDWQKLKDEYQELSRKVRDAAQNFSAINLTSEYAEAFADVARNNHQAVVKVIWENKGLEDQVPHLVYISREKRPTHPHHYKSGAMNVLTRVSGVMTNAPFILNVDCDMFANNPTIVLQGMCLLLGFKDERDSGFVQLPQNFYDATEWDPYGNHQLVIYQKFLSRGMAACQGPVYAGTGCFHRRKAIYGSSPEAFHINGYLYLSEKQLAERFGDSNAFCESVAKVLSGSAYASDHNISSSLKEAIHVAGCNYENGTCWGKEVGMVYGSSTEDVLTGLRIQSNGWRSVSYQPHPPAFLGCASLDGPAILTQQKRWATGFLEILCSDCNPLIGIVQGKLQLGTCLSYLWILTWGLRSVPELCYSILPAYCIITNTSFLPKVEDPAIFIFITLLISYNVYTLWEFYQVGLSTRIWWNNQKMIRINATSSWLFGLFSIILKLLGISETVFEITQKEQPSSEDNSTSSKHTQGRFSFNGSPIFIPGTTVVFLHLTSLATVLPSLVRRQDNGIDGYGLGEILCSILVLLHFSSFVRGLLGKGKYGIPSSTMFKSGALTLLFVNLCSGKQNVTM